MATVCVDKAGTMKLRYKILFVLGVLCVTFGLGRCNRIDWYDPKSHTPIVLPTNDVEQIRVNPETHQLIITTSKGMQTVTLPDRASTIDIRKNGIVNVTSPQFGLDKHLFAGYTLSDARRFVIGGDFVYYKKLDIGIGIADQFGSHTPIGVAKLTYNIYGAMQVGIVYGTNKYFGGIVSVRLF